eukprot:6187530-Pleurochrysis_carterae.AAC.1
MWLSYAGGMRAGLTDKRRKRAKNPCWSQKTLTSKSDQKASSTLGPAGERCRRNRRTSRRSQQQSSSEQLWVVKGEERTVETSRQGFGHKSGGMT